MQSEFARLAKLEPAIETGLRAFLGRAFNLKTIADYGTGPASSVGRSRAAEAIEAARGFVAAIESLPSE